MPPFGANSLMWFRKFALVIITALDTVFIISTGAVDCLNPRIIQSMMHAIFVDVLDTIPITFVPHFFAGSVIQVFRHPDLIPYLYRPVGVTIAFKMREELAYCFSLCFFLFPRIIICFKPNSSPQGLKPRARAPCSSRRDCSIRSRRRQCSG